MIATETPGRPFAVLHIPHASVEIPADARAAFCLDDELQVELRRMTDRYTDELFAMDPSVAPAVLFPVSRLVLDPERFLDDSAEPMSARGMGVLYTLTSQGTPLRSPLTAEERERLIDQYYRPHHERLTRAVELILSERGACLVLDCHSFASKALPYELDQSDQRPEICLGTDGFHTPPPLVAAAHRIFEAAGFTVAIDRPFSGALVPAEYYNRDSRALALMVEVNRVLYMNEASGERLATFAAMRSRIQEALRRVIAAAEGMALRSSETGK